MTSTEIPPKPVVKPGFKKPKFREEVKPPSKVHDYREDHQPIKVESSHFETTKASIEAPEEVVSPVAVEEVPEMISAAEAEEVVSTEVASLDKDETMADVLGPIPPSDMISKLDFQLMEQLYSEQIEGLKKQNISLQKQLEERPMSNDIINPTDIGSKETSSKENTEEIKIYRIINHLAEAVELGMADEASAFKQLVKYVKTGSAAKLKLVK